MYGGLSKQLILIASVCLVLTVGSVFFATDLIADVWSLSLQNDIIVGTDEHYTNGLSLKWMSLEYYRDEIETKGGPYVGSVYHLISSLPLVEIEKNRVTVGFEIAQDVYTPSNTSRRSLIKDDIPYAGHLYSRFSVFEWEERAVEETYLRFGVVGPASGGELMQNSFHKLIQNDEARGWQNQLDNQLTFGVGYSNSMNIGRRVFRNGNTIDWLPAYGFELGNFVTSAFSGVLFRFGNSFPQDPLPASFTASSSGANRLTFRSLGNPFGWLLKMGVYVHGIAYSLITDSSDKHDIERKHFIGSEVASLSFYFNRFEFTFFLQGTNMSLNEQIYNNGWGGLSFTFDY